MQKTQVIIVGQGLAGTLLSFALNQLQVAHLVISDKQAGASHVAAGMFNPVVFKRITKSWMADTLIPHMKQTYCQLEALLQVQLLHDMPIAKLINPDEKPRWQKRIETQALQHFIAGFKPAGFLPGIPDEFEFALLKNCGYVDLHALLKAYANYLLKNKQLIEGQVKPDEIRFTPHGICWNDYCAETLVFCEGSRGSDNPWMPQHAFYLSQGDVLLVHINKIPENYIINHNLFLLPKGNHQFLLGSTYNHSFNNSQANTEQAEALLAKAQSFITEPITLLHHYSGIRPTVKDRKPMLGFSPVQKQIAFFNGLGTKGVMLGPWFAWQMARVLNRQITAVPEETDINRFF